MGIEELIKNGMEIIKTAKNPAKALSPMLSYVTAIARPGTSALMMAGDIISKNAKYGINVGANPDGTENVVNAFVYNITESIVKELQDNGAIQVSIPAGAIKFEGTGANLGGPVEVVGRNTETITLNGILR